MNLYEHTIVARQDTSPAQVKALSEKYTKIVEKNEAIDKNLLRYMTVRVKKFNLEAKYFLKKDEYEKKEYKKDYNRN